MYLPKQFEETSIPVLLSLIKAHPLATVITLSTSGLNANHIPMVVAENADATIVLRGHVARANPMLADLAVSAQTLLVFQGAGLCAGGNTWFERRCLTITDHLQGNRSAEITRNCQKFAEIARNSNKNSDLPKLPEINRNLPLWDP